MLELFAYTACAILFFLAIFQLALISGAPIGKYAWGGNNRVLPIKLRVGSLISIILYVVFGTIILNKAGLSSGINNSHLVNAGIWVLTAYFFIGVFMNGISRSKHERALMTPVALILAILCLLIALG